MTLVTSPTEITTSATDMAVALECFVVLTYLWRSPTGDRWRIGLWCWVFGLLAFASFLGSVAHGLQMPHSLRAALWKPLNLGLGLLVALFVVGAVFDWRGRLVAGRLVPWSIAAAGIFFGLTEFLHQGFIVFVVYEALAMAGALAIYWFLAATHRFKGAGLVAMAVLLNLAAAAVQASSLSSTILVPLDHNGLFHLLQMVAIATLALGLLVGMKPDAKRVVSEPEMCSSEPLVR